MQGDGVRRRFDVGRGSSRRFEAQRGRRDRRCCDGSCRYRRRCMRRDRGGRNRGWRDLSRRMRLRKGWLARGRTCWHSAWDVLCQVWSACAGCFVRGGSQRGRGDVPLARWYCGLRLRRGLLASGLRQGSGSQGRFAERPRLEPGNSRALRANANAPRRGRFAGGGRTLTACLDGRPRLLLQFLPLLRQFRLGAGAWFFDVRGCLKILGWRRSPFARLLAVHGCVARAWQNVPSIW